MVILAIRDQQTSQWWSRIEELFKQYCLRWLEKLCERDLASIEAFSRENIQSILVIRQHDQLGDFLLALPALQALRERYPAAHISLLVREYFSDIARHIPCVDETIVFYENGWHWSPSKVFSFIRKLRTRRDLTIVLNTVSHSFTSDLFAHLSRARYVLGSADRVFPGCKRNFFYNLVAPLQTSTRHQTERNLDIVRYIGVRPANMAGGIQIVDAEKVRAQELLSSKGSNKNTTIIAMHIGAGKPVNRWPVRYFAELADLLHAEYLVDIVVSWGPDEGELSDEFHRRIQFETITIGHPQLSDLAACFHQCDVLICNDTGVMHLAAAVKNPVVAVFGPTDPAEWRPLVQHCVALRASSHRTEEVKVEEVLKATERILSGKLVPIHARV